MTPLLQCIASASRCAGAQLQTASLCTLAASLSASKATPACPGAAVAGVEQDGDNATVITADGEALSAPYVILTAPLGLLKVGCRPLHVTCCP